MAWVESCPQSIRKIAIATGVDANSLLRNDTELVDQLGKPFKGSKTAYRDFRADRASAELFGAPEKGIAVNTWAHTWRFERATLGITTLFERKPKDIITRCTLGIRSCGRSAKSGSRSIRLNFCLRKKKGICWLFPKRIGWNFRCKKKGYPWLTRLGGEDGYRRMDLFVGGIGRTESSGGTSPLQRPFGTPVFAPASSWSGFFPREAVGWQRSTL
jgi:hypothetical protein